MPVSENSGRSYSTGRMLSNPPFSSIEEHRFVCKMGVANSNFKIVDQALSDFKLRILESLYSIQKKT